MHARPGVFTRRRSRPWRPVELVPDVNHGNALGHFLGHGACYIGVTSYVFRSIRTLQVMQEQHRVGPGNFVPGAGDADALHLVLAVAQAGGVDDVQGHTFDLDGLLHLVAGGACNGGDDGQLGPRQRVEQRAFTGIGLACDHHLDALAQQRALARPLHHRGQCLLQIR